MDREEYHQKLDQLTALVRKKDYKSALSLVEEIDWRRVKSINTLNMVADVYEVNSEYAKARTILAIAHERAPIGRSILYRLVEVCIKLGELDDAERYFKEFSKAAKNDNSRCILQYKLYKAKHAPLEAQIDVLEEYREREYTERWAYELAVLYSKAGDKRKCIDACDDLILWFSEGKFVYRAMELKQKYEPLTPSQAQAFEAMKSLYPRKGGEASAAVRNEDQESLEEDASVRAESYVRHDNRQKSDSRAKSAATPAPAVTPESAKGKAEPTFAGGAGEVSRFTTTDEFKNRIAKSFKNVFGGEEEGDGLMNAEAAEAAADEAKLQDSIEAEKEYIQENGMKIRSLDEEASEKTEPAVPAVDVDTETGEASSAAQNSETGKDFDLDAFLAEMAGSFSSEIAEKQFNTGKIPTGDVVEAAPVSELDEESHEKPVEKFPEVDEDEIRTEEEEAADSAEADTELSAEASEEVTAEPVVADNPVAAIEELAAGITVDDKDSGVKEDMAEIDTMEKKTPHYNEELEIPDPEPTEEERRTRTIPLGTIGQNTVPISIDKILSEETPEERRIRILNKAKPTRMSEDQRNIFTYFARIPGMDGQILEAINSVYEHAGERTSLHGNIGIMGARGTGKSRLAHGLIVAMCKDLGMDAAKIARITGAELNTKDPAKVVSMMSGGFLVIEDVSEVNAETLAKLNQAMEFRTDCMVLIIEDEKIAMRAFLKQNPEFASKIDQVISVPVFTNDELVTFARTYATENGCKIDDMAVLALYTMIGNSQSEEEPTTISKVKEMLDGAISRATKGKRRRGGAEAARTGKWVVLHEKDFGLN